MFFDAAAVSQHGTTSFWLDLADRIIKFLALLVGASWTWMHYRRSRVYAQKLELEVAGKVFFKERLYLEVINTLKNVGASRHKLDKDGSSCSVWAVWKDLSERHVRSETVFAGDEWIEPGESIEDSRALQVGLPVQDIVWLKISLRVTSGPTEWNLTRYIRVEIVNEGEVKHGNHFYW